MSDLGKPRPEVTQMIVEWVLMKELLRNNPEGITHTLAAANPELGQDYWTHLSNIFNLLDDLEQFYYGKVSPVK